MLNYEKVIKYSFYFLTWLKTLASVQSIERFFYSDSFLEMGIKIIIHADWYALAEVIDRASDEILFDLNCRPKETSLMQYFHFDDQSL